MGEVCVERKLSSHTCAVDPGSIPALKILGLMSLDGKGTCAADPGSNLALKIIGLMSLDVKCLCRLPTWVQNPCCKKFWS